MTGRAAAYLLDHREAIRVSWFVSGGELASDRTGRSEADTETFADDVWTTPDAGPAVQIARQVPFSEKLAETSTEQVFINQYF